MGRHSIKKVRDTLRISRVAARAHSIFHYRILRAIVDPNANLIIHKKYKGGINLGLLPVYIRYIEALATAMSPYEFEGPLYRRLSNVRNHFTTQATRKTFSSFTSNLNVAKRFLGNQKQILRINNPQNIPSIVYGGQNGYKSQYPSESEVLLPPGTFTRSQPNIIEYNNRFPNKFHIIPVRFNVNQAFMKDPRVHILPKYKARTRTPNTRAPKNIP